MSETTTTAEPAAPRPRRRAAARPRGRSSVRLLVLAACSSCCCRSRCTCDEFWLRTGFAVFGAIIGAIGLNLLVGTTGQLSLAHAFFLAVGAVTYTYVSGEPGGIGQSPTAGLGLAAAGRHGRWACSLAGLAGLLFSPIAARLRGIYLGIASLGLVFIGQHVLNTWTSVTGGFNGRAVPDFSLFGFSFANNDPPLFDPRRAVPARPSGSGTSAWCCALGRLLVRPRTCCAAAPGRALQTLRDSEVAASVMGVNVRATRPRRSWSRSMYAGLAGVLYALSIGSVAPESFGLERVGPVPRDDRARRPRVGRRARSLGAALRQRPAAGLPAVRRRRCRSSWTPARAASSRARRRPSSTAWRSSWSSSSSPAASPASPRRFRRRGRAPRRRPRTRRCRAGPAHHTVDQPMSRQPTSTRDDHMNTKRACGQRSCSAAMRAHGGHGLQHQGAGQLGDRHAGRGQGQTDVGVEGNTIKLGVLTDLTGVFAALGKDITNAQPLYWKDHKVCDKYNVKLDVKDHGYDTQKGIQLYSSIHNRRPGDRADHRLADQHRAAARSSRPTTWSTFPPAWAQSLTEIPEIARRRRDVRGRDDQRPRLPVQGGQDQGGRQDRPHLLRG